jgi:hypothetical protein
MIWFLERDMDLMICEIRQALNSADYEFEIAPSQGPPETRRFSSPTELIDSYLRKQSLLQAQGWRPRLDGIGV